MRQKVLIAGFCVAVTPSRLLLSQMQTRLARTFDSAATVTSVSCATHAFEELSVRDADLEARLVLDSAITSFRFERACGRAAAHSEARGKARSMPSSHVSVRYVQVQPHRARTRAGGGAALDNARERRFGNGESPASYGKIMQTL